MEYWRAFERLFSRFGSCSVCAWQTVFISFLFWTNFISWTDFCVWTYYGQHMVTSMLVTDFGDKMCWWQTTSTIFLHWRRAPISTNRHQMKVTKITVTVRTTRFWFVLWSVAGFMITYFLSFFSDSFPFFNWFFSTINFFSLNKINNFNFIIFNFFI